MVDYTKYVRYLTDEFHNGLRRFDDAKSAFEAGITYAATMGFLCGASVVSDSIRDKNLRNENIRLMNSLYEEAEAAYKSSLSKIEGGQRWTRD